jgi:hypothetical protein
MLPTPHNVANSHQQHASSALAHQRIQVKLELVLLGLFRSDYSQHCGVPFHGRPFGRPASTTRRVRRAPTPQPRSTGSGYSSLGAAYAGSEICSAETGTPEARCVCTLRPDSTWSSRDRGRWQEPHDGLCLVAPSACSRWESESRTARLKTLPGAFGAGVARVGAYRRGDGVQVARWTSSSGCKTVRSA